MGTRTPGPSTCTLREPGNAAVKSLAASGVNDVRECVLMGVFCNIAPGAGATGAVLSAGGTARAGSGQPGSAGTPGDQGKQVENDAVLAIAMLARLWLNGRYGQAAAGSSLCPP